MNTGADKIKLWLADKWLVSGFAE